MSIGTGSRTQARVPVSALDNQAALLEFAIGPAVEMGVRALRPHITPGDKQVFITITMAPVDDLDLAMLDGSVDDPYYLLNNTP